MRTYEFIFLLGIVTGATACTREGNESTSTSLILDPLGRPLTRAADPDQLRLSDYNLLIYNAFGDLEEKVYVPARALTLTDGRVEYRTTLLQEVPYTVLAAVNLGYELPCLSLDEAREYRYHLAYPDEYSRGLPMAARLEDVVLGERLEVPLERLMARIDLQLDTGALPDDVQWLVREASIGNCPSSVTPFAASTAQAHFTRGFRKEGRELDALNEGDVVSFYLLEDLSGDAYLEIKTEYHSKEWHSAPGAYLSFRLDLGAVERNTRYSITVQPTEVSSSSAAKRLSSKVFSVRKIP